ncbi:MAG TPA: serine/threonine-protein kinase, partial [Polyangiaceae bacterium]|nr:serine/threonine-protein kinase [Polyangiaceae bacterium]
RVLEVGARSTLLEALARDQDQIVVVEVFRRFRLAQENQRFRHELELATELRSPHAARVYACGSDADGAHYVVMDPPEGDSLATLLRRQGPLPLARIVEITLQVCDALEEAHALPLVHLDLSPETLFQTRLADGSSCMKVRGFGTRLALHAITGGRLLGMSHFTAPEQLTGVAAPDPRTDVWGLGATIYELATGHRPFEQPPAELETALLSIPPTPLLERRPGLPLPFGDAVMRCLASSPSARYARVAELADAIAPFGPRRGVAGAVRGVLAAGATRLRSSSDRLKQVLQRKSGGQT